MKRTIWNTYHQFSCIAEKCPDSCCQGWEVDIDEKTAESYRNMDGTLGDRLRQVLKTQDGNTTMTLEKGRCPMWRQDGLCQIQVEKGHGALCQVCQDYPRLVINYGDFSEWGLEMSCPEAARLLFEDMSVTDEELPGGKKIKYDDFAMEVLKITRQKTLEALEDPGLTESVRMFMISLLLYAHQAQGYLDSRERFLDGGEHLQPGDCVAVLKSTTESGDISLLLDFFKGLEILTPEWKARLDDPKPGQWDIRLLQLIKYMVRRYWYHAVWDFDLVSRAKLIVAACILINHLGGDTVQTTQLFSKEIENDPDNMEAILDAAYTHPAFTDQNLLGLLKTTK